MKGMGYFQNLRNFLDSLGNFGGYFLGFFKKIFLEEFFGKNFLGEFFLEHFWEEFFWRNSFFTLLKSTKLFEYGRN